MMQPGAPTGVEHLQMTSHSSTIQLTDSLSPKWVAVEKGSDANKIE